MSWYKIRLELARTHSFPDGSRLRGYELIAPLGEDGHIDEAEWRGNRRRAKILRFWEGEDDQHGHLIHTRHHTWAFSYGPGEGDDTPLFHLEQHLFRTGEYLSIAQETGQSQPFRIVSITANP